MDRDTRHPNDPEGADDPAWERGRRAGSDAPTWRTRDPAPTQPLTGGTPPWDTAREQDPGWAADPVREAPGGDDPAWGTASGQGLGWGAASGGQAAGGGDPAGGSGVAWERSATAREDEDAGPPAPPAPARGGRRTLAAAVVSALVAAIVSAAVTTGILAARDDEAALRPAAQEVVNRDDPALEQRPAGQPLPSGATVGDIAEAALPSVALVQVQGAQGEGSGSAVVYSDDGYLITNNHVVEGATQVSVTLPDARNVPAEVVGTDLLSDLAVLRVDETEGLVPLTFAATAPRVGDTAIAIGSPFGLESTVTQGIISATERDLPVPNGNFLPGVVQTDAAINPGNSGGALVNERGELIGINTAILSQTGENSGVGFAIPVTTVEVVVPLLIQDGRVEYAYLGVRSEDASALSVAETRGALIARVEAGTPAAQAGLEPGDVVTAIDGDAVEGSGELTGRIRGYRPGDTVSLSVSRDGEERQVEVTLGTRPAE